MSRWLASILFCLALSGCTREEEPLECNGSSNRCSSDGGSSKDASSLRSDAGVVCDGGGCIISIVIAASTENFDVASNASDPSTPVHVHVTINAGVVVGSASAATPAMITGALPRGSMVTIENNGSIIGAGGAGGSGGNGGSGGTPRSCGRSGEPGGVALSLTVPTMITNNGSIFGGGGGGAGFSACNEAGGGGGGAGQHGGLGGAGFTTLAEEEELEFCGQDNGIRSGITGDPGGTTGGVGARGEQSGCDLVAGDGGDFGLPGEIATGLAVGGSGNDGGAAGHAILRNGNTTNIPDGAYATGTGSIRGPVR